MSIVRMQYVYDNERLVVDVANSVYAARNQVQPAGIRLLWNSLSNFVSASVKSHKVPIQQATEQSLHTLLCAPCC